MFFFNYYYYFLPNEAVSSIAVLKSLAEFLRSGIETARRSFRSSCGSRWELRDSLACFGPKAFSFCQQKSRTFDEAYTLRLIKFL